MKKAGLISADLRGALKLPFQFTFTGLKTK